ncbi:MAG: SDR family NAD(P)-dependent oxidoreductase [Anaerolineae bacterium]|nr:SDR family NAD(P)-dependent oxidoreductase [Anaerolineae bacterium]
MNSNPDHPIRSNDIAIIGVAGRFPGAKNVREFWQSLIEAKEGITFFSEEELVREGIPPAVVHHPDYVKASPILQDIEFFDAAFFGYSPREAEAMDPQHRLLLECAWATLEDGGYAPDSYQGAIGVYAGSGGSISSYLLAYLDHNPSVRGATGSYHHLGNDKDFLTTRISYKLNLRGPSIAVQTACSTSLVAVHLACQSLLSGECDMALAGGVSIRIPHQTGYFWEKGHIFSKDGHIRAFDEKAQGTIFGSGLGLVLLKPLENAIADNDSIYAVIKGSALNNDGGEKTSYMATKLAGQVNCMLEALAVAEVEPETLSFIETHGTGTAMGDPVEVKALAQAFRTATDKKGFCSLGAVKNNVGHLDTAAGITSLIKVALALRHKRLPPTINFESPNPRIDFENSPFYINTEVQEWKQSTGPRRAGVNSLGIGGTNAFVVLEESPCEPAGISESTRPYYLVILSAKNSAALKRRLTDLSLWLDEEADNSLRIQDIVYTLQLGRSHFPVRCGLVITNVDDLQHKLKHIQNGEQLEDYLYYNEESVRPPEQRPVLKQFGAYLIEEISTRNDLSKAMYREKLLALADLFVQGYELAWSDLYACESCQRISLPTYPFEKKRYWIPQIDKDAKPDLAPPQSRSNPVAIKPAPNHKTTPALEEIERPVLGQLLQTDLSRMISGLLKIKTEEFSEDEILDDYGFDSMSFIALTNRLNETYALDLMPTLFFEYNTLGLLCAYLLQNHGVSLAHYYRDSDFGAASASLGSGSRLSPASLPSDDQQTNDRIDTVMNSSPQSPTEAIAIIGISGVLPGSPDLDSFWQHLIHGDDLITEIPADRWDWRAFYGDPQTQINRTNVKWGGFMPDVDKFDAAFFRISPREAKLMDPQERIFLEAVSTCMEDEGYRASTLSGTGTGVFVGVSTGDYQDLLQNTHVEIQAHLSTGLNRSVLANRISYLLNFHGPSESIDTACSSSLVALQRAVQVLQTGACEMALVGGVNALLSPQLYIAFSQAGMLCEDGRCKTFDRRANGYVRGEGVGAIFLKPLRRAEADGDNIYAVIKATAENHGGRTNSLTAPNPKAQADLLVKAYQQAGIDPATVSYIEAHGTGTALGDPIEINGLKQAFARLYQQWPKERPTSPHCGLGSVKSNIGHLEAAAGIAGVLKVLLAFKYRQLPATINFEQQNPYIDLKGSPFYWVTETRPWESLTDENGRPIPRRAGVSSFGFGGANAHVVLEEYQGVGIRGQGSGGRDKGVRTEEERRLIVLSARNEERLRVYAGKMLNFVERHLDASSDDQITLLADLAYTLQTGREAMESRLALIAGNLTDVRTKLKQYLANEQMPDGIYVGTLKKIKKSWGLALEDDEAPTIVNQAIAQGDHETLAQRWVEGVSIDWPLLYEQPRPKRISLPTYPFARERHWLPKPERQMKNEANHSPFSILHSPLSYHPLVHRNTSTLTGQQFSSTLTGDEFFLKDHRVRGEKTLPGVAYLEMARAAAEIAGDQPVVRFRNVIWASPIVVKEQPANIQVNLYPNETGEVRYEISRTAEDNRPTIHAQGKLDFGNVSNLGDVPLLDLNAIRERCTEKYSPEAVYHQFRQKGLEYGPDFQPITELIGNGYEALSGLRLPADLSAEKDLYELHPSLMDGALQTIMGMKLSRLNGADTKLYLPFVAQEIRLYGAFPDEAYAYVTYSANSGATDSHDPEAAVVKYDIAVADAQGRVRLFFKEFTVRAVPTQPKAGTDEQEAKPIYCTPTWPVKTIAEGDSEAESIEQVNLLLMVAGLPQSLVESLKTGFENAKVIDLASKPGSDIAGQITTLTLTLWGHLKAIAAKAPGTQTRIVILASETNPRYLYAPLARILKSVRLEHPKIQGKIVTIVNPVADSLMPILRREIRSETLGDGEVRYDETGARRVKALKQIELETGDQRRAYLKPGGVYWITGGLGGLGQIFAQHLAEYGQGITIILSGRSPLDDVGQARLASLTQPGVTIDYRQVDVSKPADVEQTVQSIKVRYGSLSGIIHSAGIIRDSLILKKTAAEAEAVLAPKVAGTVNIDIATQAEALDFLVLFSSVSGVTGNMGQSIYAAANAFMDEYARYRQRLVERGQRSGRTLSINWPLWQVGGMQLNEEAEKWLTSRTGMAALSTEQGLQIFEQLLAQTAYSQVLAAHGDREKIRRYLGVNHAHSSRSKSVSISPQARDIAQDARQIRQELLEMGAELFEVSPTDLDVEIPLGEYGLDSILMMALLNKLEEKYNIAVTPNAIVDFPTIEALTGFLMDEVGIKPDLSQKNGEPHYGAVMDRTGSGSRSTAENARLKLRSHNGVHQPGGRGSGKVAIIGQACRLPQSDTPDQFWANLVAGRDLVTPIPVQRRQSGAFPSAGLDQAYPAYGAFINGIDLFDANFFGLSDEEAISMDPQHRIMLELAQTVVDNAGYRAAELAGTNTGVFIGAKDNNYVRNFYDLIPPSALQHTIVNSISNMIAARISDFFDFKGPAQVLDTACSSSLVAVHDACRSIINGEVELAVAGGIYLMVDDFNHIGFSQAQVLSADGKTYVFDQRAKGFALGEGGGLVLLKDYDTAVRDGDPILAVILGSAVNNDGHTMGLTVPNQAGQMAVIEAALRRSQVTPDDISYLEAHGTGTLLGDPIEIKAAADVYRHYVAEKQWCAVGSVKSNLGHPMTAAGITGLLKLVLSLQHRQIPATLHCEKPHPRFKFEDSPFYPNAQLKAWEPRNRRRIGAISSFGFGGTNCHLIVEEGQRTHSTRQPLLLTRFKRQRYWLGQAIVPEASDSFDRIFYEKLLDQFLSGELNEHDVEGLIKVR